MLNIYFIRHCKVDYTPEGELKYERHLSPEGREQAIKLKQKLRQSQIKFDAIYSSHYPRAIETITPYSIDRNQKIHIRKNLEEVHIYGDYAERYEHSMTNIYFKFKEGRSPKEERERYRKAIKSIIRKHPTGNIIIVTHGGILKEFLRDSFPKINAKKLHISNPDVYKIEVENNTIKTYKRIKKLLPDNAIAWKFS